MKHTTKNIALALSLAALTATSMSASAIDLRVIGSITPASCTPTLGSGGTVDYGAIPPSTLSATALTVLPEQEIPFTITCTAPAKVGLAVVEGRPNTAIGTLYPSGAALKPASVTFDSGANYAAGLGLDGTTKIGGYALAIKAGTAMDNGTALDTLLKNSDWTTFINAGTSGMYGPNKRTTSWGAKGTVLPVEITNLSGTITVQAYLNTTTELDTSKSITLDGLTTFELVYP